MTRRVRPPAPGPLADAVSGHGDRISLVRDRFDADARPTGRSRGTEIADPPLA